jgi:hypothetical protein
VAFVGQELDREMGSMARARNIKPALFKNELLGVADPHITLLFQSLWMLADREGRLEDRPLRIKAETFPYREKLDINGYLTELQRLGFILRYRANEIDIIQVINFKKHQAPHKTEKPSYLPSPTAEHFDLIKEKIITVKAPLNNGKITEPLPPDLLIPDLLIPDSLNKKNPKKSFDFILPEWIDFETWELWKKTRNKKMTPAQMQAQVNKLAKWRDLGLDHAKALADSAANGWQGLFEPVSAKPHDGIRPQQYHEKLTDTANQIFGRNQNGVGNKIIDVTPSKTDVNNGEDIPAVCVGIRA